MSVPKVFDTKAAEYGAEKGSGVMFSKPNEGECRHFYGIALDFDPMALPEGIWNFTLSPYEPQLVRFSYCPRCGKSLAGVVSTTEEEP